VIGGTGLNGYYDGDFEFTAEIALPPPPPGVPHPCAGRVFPSIFSVLPKQLGLRLEAQRGPVDVVVIDHVQQPTENWQRRLCTSDNHPVSQASLA
jgi:uncharacterized protein (TIGR03435 family)